MKDFAYLEKALVCAKARDFNGVWVESESLGIQPSIDVAILFISGVGPENVNSEKFELNQFGLIALLAGVGELEETYFPALLQKGIDVRDWTKWVGFDEFIEEALAVSEAKMNEFKLIQSALSEFEGEVLIDSDDFSDFEEAIASLNLNWTIAKDGMVTTVVGVHPTNIGDVGSDIVTMSYQDWIDTTL